MGDPNLGYRGSTNQRVIDLEATRASGQLALANWDNLIVYDRGKLSGPPAIMGKLSDTDETLCGKF